MDRRPTGIRPLGVLAWVVVLVAGGIGIAPNVPPAPASDPAAADFSAARALDLIARIAFEPRPIGSAANERARTSIAAELRALGLEPEVQVIDAPDYFGAPGGRVQVVNVMARIPGRASTGAVALMGHYDSVPAGPGANDDGSAVAIILESARAILAGGSPRNDVILLFTDGEEPAPRYGSTAFIESHPWAADVRFAINLEALGGDGASTLLQTSGPAPQALDWFVEAAEWPVAFSYLTAMTEAIAGSSTDFAPFRAAGIAGIELGYLHGSSIYHTSSDAPDRVNLGSLNQQGTNTLAVARRVADVDLWAAGIVARDRTQADPGVYFTVGPAWVIRYPSMWVLPLAGAAGLVLAAVLWLGRGRRRLLRGVASTAIAMLASMGAGVAVWSLLAGIRPSMGIAESYVYLGGLLALTIAIGEGTRRLVRRRTSGEIGPAGVLASWWTLALLTAILAPGLSYLFGWPALVGAGAMLWVVASGAARPWQQVARLAAVAGTGLVLLVPAIDTFFQLAQPRPGNLDSQLLAVVLVPMALMALTVELIRAFWMSDPWASA